MNHSTYRTNTKHHSTSLASPSQGTVNAVDKQQAKEDSFLRRPRWIIWLKKTMGISTMFIAIDKYPAW